MDRLALQQQLRAVHAAAFAEAQRSAGIPDRERVSASNLRAYIGLRKHDLSSIQLELADLGLSSLGRLEGQVLNSLEHVLGWLDGWCGDFSRPDRLEAESLLAARSQELFGRPRPARDTRIMVTLDHEVQERDSYIEELLLAGMDIARINCGHGSAADWRGLVAAIRDAESRLSAKGRPQPRRCRVMFDLAGPKLRVRHVEEGRMLGGGDTVLLALTSGHPEEGQISCTLPEALANVRVGHRVAFDDGKFVGSITAVDGATVTITLSLPERPRRLKPGKGINLPDTPVNLPALTRQDRADLESIVDLADAIGLSFVHRPQDLLDLHNTLSHLGYPQMGIVAKIETRAATENLGAILLAGLSLPAFGAMIARGDLAVEVGFEDLAVMQDSILCLCEAAHVPAIWATQVLETLARSGLPARAEITDAAASRRADCVMLNKGPHVSAAVTLLDRLLTAEQRHSTKKRQLFREFMTQGESLGTSESPRPGG